MFYAFGAPTTPSSSLLYGLKCKHSTDIMSNNNNNIKYRRGISAVPYHSFRKSLGRDEVTVFIFSVQTYDTPGSFLTQRTKRGSIALSSPLRCPKTTTVISQTHSLFAHHHNNIQARRKPPTPSPSSSTLYRPPTCPFGIGLIQQTATFNATIMHPIIQKLVSYLVP